MSRAWNGLGRLKLTPDKIEGVLESDSTAEGSMMDAALLDADAEMMVPEMSLLLLNLLPPLLRKLALLRPALDE